MNNELIFTSLLLCTQLINAWIIFKITDLLIGEIEKPLIRYLGMVFYSIISIIMTIKGFSFLLFLLFQFLFVFIIAFFYKVSNRIRLELAIIITSLLLLSRYASHIFFGLAKIDFNFYEISKSSVVLIIMTFLNLSVLFVIRKTDVKNIQNLNSNTRLHLITIPSLALMLFVFTFSISQSNSMARLLMGLLSLIFIVTTVFSYRKIYRTIEEYFETKYIEKQNLLYKKELESINSQHQETMKLRHDFKYVIYKILDLAKAGEVKEIENVIEKNYSIIYDHTKSNTGNLDVDSILNYKLKSMESYNIQYELSLNLPKETFMDSYDLFVLLGNLLDNAIEANLKRDESRWIKISAKLAKGVFILEIENPQETKDLNIIDDSLLSTKGSYEHGYGLKSMESIVKKYNGNMIIDYKENIFSTIIKLILN